MKSNVLITQFKMSLDFCFSPCHFSFLFSLGRGPQTEFVDRENLGLKKGKWKWRRYGSDKVEKGDLIKYSTSCELR